MLETKDMLSLCFSPTHLHPNGCLVAFFVCLLFSFSTVHEGLWGNVSFRVFRVCLCAFAFCILFIAHLCVCLFRCVILCENECVWFLFMLLWVELNPWWSLIPSRGVSLCHDHRESEGEGGRERERHECSDGKEVVKWTTAVAIETLLATQHCCYPACLSANFRPVVSMNI